MEKGELVCLQHTRVNFVINIDMKKVFNVRGVEKKNDQHFQKDDLRHQYKNVVPLSELPALSFEFSFYKNI